MTLNGRAFRLNPILVPLLVWNVWIFAWWFSRFHVSPAVLADAFRQHFLLQAGFSWGNLAGNWADFSSALLALAGTVALTRGMGRALGRLLGKAVSGDAVLNLALGIGMLGSAVFGLGLAGLLFAPPRPLAWLLLAGAAVAEFRPALGWLRLRGAISSLAAPWRPPASTSSAGALALKALSLLAAGGLAVALVVTAANVLNIEMAWDALTYHLRLPTFYIYRHKIFDVWHHMWCYFPEQIEMLYAFGRLVHGDTLVRFLNAAFGVLLVLATAGLARQLGSRPGWPAVLMVSSPVFLILTTRAYIDLGFAFLLTASLTCFLRWWRTGSPAAVAASGLLAGWGMGSKYLGIVFVFAIFAAAAPRLRAAAAWRAAALWNALALLPLSPWLVKNWVFRANPVFPFLSRWFGDPIILPSDIEIPVFQLGGGLPRVVETVASCAKATFLDHGHVDGPHLPVLAGLVPLLVLGRYTGIHAAARRALLAYVLGWFAIHPDARFLLPVFPLLLVMLAGGPAPLLGQPGAGPAGLRAAAWTSVLAGSAYAASVQWVFFAPFSLVLGLETADTKLQIGLPPPPFSYYTRAYINSRVPPDARILYVSHFSTYYVERECLADFHFAKAHLTRLLEHSRTAPDLALALKRRGIGWILSTGTLAAGYRHIPGYFDLPADRWRVWKEFLMTRTEVPWQTEHYTLFRVVNPHPLRPVPALPVYETLAYNDADEALGRGDIKEALQVFTAPPPLLQDVGSTYVRQADALLAAGSERRAETAFLAALGFGADNPRVRVGLAQISLRRGTPQLGLPHARLAFEQNPLSAYAAATLALTCAGAGLPAEAQRLIREAVRLRPDEPDYREIARRLGAM